VGDSLIHGPDPDALPGMSDRTAYMSFTYATEDGPLLLTLLEEGRYDVVVGNPPYITPRDRALNQTYRSKYANVCKGKYALTVPFMALFFSLAKQGEQAGWVGQITSNSFMKREFGSKLIEDFLKYKDLCLVADTSGAFIPGHGTPTLIVIGRNRRPVERTVRAALGVRGEPARPLDPAKGIVWTAIVEHIDIPGWEDGWVTIAELDRSLLDTHPWSLTGGGAVQLLEAIGSAADSHLGEHVYRIGVFGIMGADDAMVIDSSLISRRNLESSWASPLVIGDQVRDFCLSVGEIAWFPYDESHILRPLSTNLAWNRHLWPMKIELGNRATFSGGTYFSEGRPWSVIQNPM